MGDQAIKIGGEPSRRVPKISALHALYIGNFALIIVLGIVGASLSVRDKDLPDAARRAALAFDIIGFLIIFVAAIMQVLIMVRIWSSQGVIRVVVLGLVAFALLCFIISTAVSYMKSTTRFGDWIMSAFWVNVSCLIIGICYLFVDTD